MELILSLVSFSYCCKFCLTILVVLVWIISGLSVHLYLAITSSCQNALLSIMEGYIQNVKSIKHLKHKIILFMSQRPSHRHIESKDFIVKTVGSCFFSLFFFWLLHIPREFVQFLWEKLMFSRALKHLSR